MDPKFLKYFFGVGIFLTITSLFLIFITPRDSAEFVISVLSLGIGLTVVLLVAIVTRWINRK